jgi:salicylate hydroxylase
VHREALLNIMVSFITIANMKFSKHLTAIESESSKVILRFSDGEVAEASVLAGADGIKSIVREYVLKSISSSSIYRRILLSSCNTNS